MIILHNDLNPKQIIRNKCFKYKIIFQSGFNLKPAVKINSCKSIIFDFHNIANIIR